MNAIETTSLGTQRSDAITSSASLLILVLALACASPRYLYGQEARDRQASPTAAPISDQDRAKEAFRTGQYQACIDLCQTQVDKGVWLDFWLRTLIEANLEVGRYAEALAAYEKAAERYSDNIRVRLLGVRVYRMNNQPEKAVKQLDYIESLFSRSPWRFNNKADLVPLGEFFLSRGEDPKQVLKICFDQAVKNDPKAVDAHLAIARMALDKNDSKVASQSLNKALKLEETNPEVHYLAVRTWSSTDPELSNKSLRRALEINPRHIPSLVYQAENKMSAEAYDDAERLLQEIQKINPKLPMLWSLRAAIAHLQGRYQEEGEYRKKALEPWNLNPEVDHTIGRHLSMHYRFAESVDYQRRAIKMDPKYTPAQAQLAQDLLRLGEVASGWDLVEAVRKSDPYDVTIFNLKLLQGQLEKFAILEAPGLLIRMDKREAKIYGPEVVQLLSEARQILTAKYDVKLTEPIYVEIFPRQNEFAVRTFGMPGGEGFLGVCFGRLITANSPAALNVDSNWKSVLWHEYCHVATLQKTKNRMPRWLSEGISVYEERQKNPIWGESMDGTYREMILGEDFVPMSKLSSAFLQPKSPMHLQFAYYESSLAVEYWIKQYGMPKLLRLLDDLAVGMPADEALRRVPGSLDALDNEFKEFATSLAKSYAPKVDWSKPPAEDRKNMKEWATQHPDSFWSMRAKCEAMIKRKDWEAAYAVADEMRILLPEDSSNDGVYALLAQIHRNSNDEIKEREALVELAVRSKDCREALMRLIELDLQCEDWPKVEQWCDRMIEIDPLRSDVQLARATANEKLGDNAKVVASLEASLEMNPSDPAGIYYRLAVAYQKLKQNEKSKRYLLMALEESPRYEEALQMLYQVSKETP